MGPDMDRYLDPAGPDAVHQLQKTLGLLVDVTGIVLARHNAIYRHLL